MSTHAVFERRPPDHTAASQPAVDGKTQHPVRHESSARSWQSGPQWNFANLAVQAAAAATSPAIRIGSIEDPLEKEADAVSARVLGTREPQSIPAAPIVPKVQRKCAACQEEEEEKDLPRVARKESSPAGPRGGMVAPPIVHEVARDIGQPLDTQTRSFFEPRFGRDFSRVRIHTGERAAQSARSVNALAYTLGRDVVFGRGQYAPEQPEGRRLLAHELVHVVQQNSGDVIHRVPAPTPTPLPATVPVPGPSDFEITQVGDSDTSSIFFAKNSAALTSDADTQIATIKTSTSSSVKLIGFSSADENNTVAQARANAVKTALTTPPDKVTVTSAVGKPTAQAESSDFSQARKVEVIVGSAKAKTLDCKKKVAGKLVNPPKAPCATMDPPTDTAFKDALKIANDAMSRATTALSAAVPNADDTAVIDKFFGNHDPSTLSTLKTNLGKLETHVNGLPGITSCGSQCDTGGCGQGAIAYNQDVDAASKMTVCVPTFKSLSSDDDRARNLIHESAHGTTPLGGAAAPTKGTEDVAYRHERIIFQLSTADRLRNSDSYALFALHLRARQIAGNATAVPVGISKPASDTLTAFTVAGEEDAVKAAIAMLEKRLSWCEDWMGQLYGEMVKVRSGATTWSASWAEDLMKETAARFPLSAPPATPSLKEQILEAGILERYRRMKAGVKRKLKFVRAGAGVVSWGAAAVAAPFFAGDKVEIGPDFFKATSADRVSLMLEALAKQTKDVEAAFIPAYVSLADWIHSQNP